MSKTNRYRRSFNREQEQWERKARKNKYSRASRKKNKVKWEESNED